MFKGRRGSLTGTLIISLIYLSIAIVYTYPLILNLRTHGFGVDEDAPYHIWHNWWLKFSLFDLKQNPLWTNYIFHPQKISLIYDANSFAFAALTLPLQLFTSVLTASNLILLVSFALSGLTMYLLTQSLISNSLISFLSGIIFAFSPYTFAQATDGHTNLTTTWIIPLYTLFLLKTIKSTPSDKPLKSLLPLLFATGLLASLQFYSDFTYTTFLIIETAFVFGYFSIKSLLKNDSDPNLRAPVLKYMLKASVFIVSGASLLSLPLLIELVKISQTGFRVGSPLWVQNVWSADLRSYLQPSGLTTLFRSISFAPVRGMVEGTVFTGYTVLILFSIILIRQLMRRKPPEVGSGNATSNINLWILMAVSFFVLSLGPTLHYNGQFQFNFLGLKNFIFPLPWMFLHKIPLIGETQETSRLNPFLMLSLSVAISIALDQILSKTKYRQTLVLAIVLLILVEYLPIPFPSTNLEPPEIYRAIAQDKERFSVLTLPLGFNSGNIALGPSPIGSLQYYQVIHQHPSFRGTVARLPVWAFDYYRKAPLIKFLINPETGPDSIDLDRENVQKVFKHDLSIKYIVIHKNKYRQNGFQKVVDVLNTLLDLEKLGEDNTVISYRLK